MRATRTLQDGTQVTYEGTPAEVREALGEAGRPHEPREFFHMPAQPWPRDVVGQWVVDGHGLNCGCVICSSGVML